MDTRITVINELEVGDLVEHIIKLQLGIVHRITPNWTYVCWVENQKHERHSFSILRKLS